MLSSSLINILAKFTPMEIKEFGEFVNSPFFNKNKNVVKLYIYLKKYYPDFKTKKLDKEYVYTKIFVNEKYNDGYMRTTMFNLNKLAEEYLAYISYKSKPVNTEKFLLSELHKRNADTLFAKSLKKAEELAEKTNPKDEFDLLDNYLIEYEKNSYTSTRYNIVTREEDYFNETSILEKFFFISLLRRYSYIVNKGLILEMESKLNFLEEALKYIETNKLDEIPVAAIYYNQVMLMLKDEDVYYKNLKKIVSGNRRLSRREMYNIYIGLQNYAIRKVTEGDSAYRKELFQIHRDMLSDNVFSMRIEGGYMSQAVYKNIVSNSLALKEFDWTLKFVKNYKKYIIPEHQNNAYYFALAKLYFEEGRFGESLEYLSKVNYEDILYKIEIKIFMMKIYYELAMEEQIHETIDSFRHFLSQKKLYSQLIESSQNFNKIIKGILKLKSQNDLTGVQALKDEIISTRNLVSRDWLLEKTDKLIQSSHKLKA